MSLWTTLYRNLGAAAILLVALCSFGESYQEQSWYSKWFLLLALMICWCTWRVWRDGHWSLALPFFWTSICALQGAMYGQGDWISASQSGAVLYSMLLFMFFFGNSPELWRGFGLVCVVLSVAVPLNLFTHSLWHPHGVFGNASMTGCLIAATIPFAVRMRRWLVYPAILATILTGSSVALLTLAVVLFVGKFIPRAITVLVSLAGAALFWDHLLDAQGRFQIWGLALRKIETHWIAGLGPGSTSVLIPGLQKEFGVLPDTLFIWMHNDWLQILFEQGVIGLACFGSMILVAAWKLRKNTEKLSSFAGLIACSLANFPMSMPVHALLGAWLIAEAHDETE